MAKKQTKDKEKDKIKCKICSKELVISNYYNTNSKLFPDGKVDICKPCVKNMIDYNNIQSIYDILQQLDIAFRFEIWDTAYTGDGDTLGNYIRIMNSLPQNKGLRWKDSTFKNNNPRLENQLKTDPEDDISKELVLKWNGNYSEQEYLKLEKLYDDMMSTHDIATPQHKELLKLMCKLNLKMDKCLENEDFGGFTKLHEQYQKLLTSSGFRPIDKTNASAVRTFGQIFEEIERDGFITPSPIQENQDIVDRTIMYILNYTLKLLNTQSLSEPPYDTPKVGEDNG